MSAEFPFTVGDKVRREWWLGEAGSVTITGVLSGGAFFRAIPNDLPDGAELTFVTNGKWVAA